MIPDRTSHNMPATAWDDVKGRIPGWKPRPQQDDVFRRLEAARPGRNGMEAGTGLGKTMVLAIRNGGPVTYATATNDQMRQTARLAESLVASGVYRNYAVLMGRSHYVCHNLREAAGIPKRGPLVSDYPEHERDAVRSSSDKGCHMRVCADNDEYHQAQYRAMVADLTLTNQHMVTLSRAIRSREGQLVIDEGHHMFDTVLAISGTDAHWSTFRSRGYEGVTDLRSAHKAISTMDYVEIERAPSNRAEAKAQALQRWRNKLVTSLEQVNWWTDGFYRSRPTEIDTDALWEPFDDVTVMSATLHTHRFLGLGRLMRAQDAFDLRRNRVGYVLARNSDSREATDDEIRMAVAGEGRTLVLVTGYKAYDRLRALLPDAHFQDRGEGAEAANVLRDGRSRVVVGTFANMGTGIDLPGEALTNVVLLHTPQGPKDDYDKALEAKNGSSWFWNNWYFPRTDAAMAQAIGRLIRRPTDTGTVWFLDARPKNKARFTKLMQPSEVMEVSA